MNLKRSAKQPTGLSREAHPPNRTLRSAQRAVVAMLIVTVASAVGAQTLMTPPAQRKAAERMKTAGAYPFRFDGTNVINLHPAINYYSNVDTTGAPIMTNRPNPEWEFIQGRVEEPFAGGLLVQRYDPLDWQLQGNSWRIHLTNYPGFSRIGIGDVVSAFALYRGNFVYVGAGNITNTVAAFDFGYPLQGAQLQEAEKNWQEYLRTRRELQMQVMKRVATENKEKAAEEKKKRDAIQDKKAFEFYAKKAATGDGMAQYRLAEFHLLGRGTETNREAARLWLSAAMTNNYPQAASKLRSLQQTE